MLKCECVCVCVQNLQKIFQLCNNLNDTKVAPYKDAMYESAILIDKTRQFMLSPAGWLNRPTKEIYSVRIINLSIVTTIQSSYIHNTTKLCVHLLLQLGKLDKREPRSLKVCTEQQIYCTQTVQTYTKRVHSHVHSCLLYTSRCV